MLMNSTIFSNVNLKASPSYQSLAMKGAEHVKSYPNDSFEKSSKTPKITKKEAIEQFKKEYKLRPKGDLTTMKEQSADLVKFMNDNTVLKLHAAGVSSTKMSELLEGAFPTFMHNNLVGIVTPGYINTPLITVNNPFEFIEQVYSCYGENSFFDKGAKLVGKVLLKYKDDYSQFFGSKEEKELKQMRLPKETMKKIIIKLYSLSHTPPKA